MSILSAYMNEPDSQELWKNRIPASMKRRDPRIWQMAWVAGKEAIRQADCRPRSVVVATALGALDETCRYLDGLFSTGLGSPRNFIASVHNSMAGRLAMAFSIDGPNLTLCEGQNSFASAVIATSLLSPSDFPVLLVCVDENISILKQIHPHLSENCHRWLSGGWKDSAIAFVLDSGDKSDKLPALAAAGISPVDDSDSAQSTCINLANTAGWDGDRLQPLSKTSDSFAAPANSVYSAYSNQAAGLTLVGSYSPSSRGAAVTALWQ